MNSLNPFRYVRSAADRLGIPHVALPGVDREEAGESRTLTWESPSGAVLTVSTEHAWPEPRGEVYLTVVETSTNELADTALTPDEARAVARALLALADHAATLPAATIDENGDRLRGA